MNSNNNRNSPKTLRDLAIALGVDKSKAFKSQEDFEAWFTTTSIENQKKALANLRKIVKEESKRVTLLQTLNKLQENFFKGEFGQVKNFQHLKEMTKLAETELLNAELLVEKTANRKKELVKVNKVLSEGNKLLQRSIKYNQDLYKIAHQMQLESNITWKEYTQLYNQAYDAVRKLNTETGKSIHNSKELVETQNKLLSSGWKNINTNTLTNVSAQVMLLQKTLGAFPVELNTALQMSFRQFGDNTNHFITALGNSLNAFSDTFGVDLAMLTGAVSEMAASNSFIARSNMQAQIQANESLIQAAALSGAIGLTSTSYISNLASTAQFGTASRMATLYQGGALLQDFSTQDFQDKMIAQDYSGAISDLLGGISKTIGSIDDHYLRAEYMDRIGSTFGLSQNDLLQITTNGANLSQYTSDIQNKLLNVNTSMQDELKDFRMSLSDQLENLFDSSRISQTIGSAMQESGLFGISTQLNSIKIILTAMLARDIMSSGTGQGGGLLNTLGNLFTKGNAAGTTAAGTTAGTTLGASLGKIGLGAGGLAVGLGGMYTTNTLGRSTQLNTNLSDTSANTGGSILNIGGGAASGALGGAMLGTALGGPLIGTAIGAGLGAVVGLTNTIVSANERKALQRQEELDLRTQRNDRLQNKSIQQSTQQSTPLDTDMLVVEAINAMNANLTNVITGGFDENIKAQFVLETSRKTATKS